MIWFIAGLLTSHWIESLLTRLALRVPFVANAARSHAKSAGIATMEKGKIVSLEMADLRDKVARGAQLEDL